MKDNKGNYSDRNTSLVQLDVNFNVEKRNCQRLFFHAKRTLVSLLRREENNTDATARLRFHAALIRVC